MHQIVPLIGVPQGWELILIVLVILLLFGAAKLPQLARGTGQALRIFKAETKGLRDEDESTTSSERMDQKLVQGTIAGPFILQMKICGLAGLVLASPVWLYQVWAFIMPGLHRHERKWTLVFAAVAG